MRILGIDPGSRITGFGVIEQKNRQFRYIVCGCIRMHTKEMPIRLKEIFAGVDEIITTYQPDVLSIEKVFMSRNPDAALKLGQARGAAIVAAVNQDLPVYEYAPTEIKKAIVGQGHADKSQIQHMVKLLLSLSDTPQVDAADALAIALCHAHTAQTLSHHHSR